MARAPRQLAAPRLFSDGRQERNRREMTTIIENAVLSTKPSRRPIHVNKALRYEAANDVTAPSLPRLLLRANLLSAKLDKSVQAERNNAGSGLAV
jgi:hypothetical protein